MADFKYGTVEARLFARVLGYPCTWIGVHDVSCTVYTRLNVICRNLEGVGSRSRGDIDIEFPASRRSVLNRSISRIRVN